MPRDREPEPVPCRIGLCGSPALVERALDALAGSGIEVARAARRGKASEDAQPLAGLGGEGLDVVVVFAGSRGITSEVKRLCARLPRLPVVVGKESIEEGTVRSMLRIGVRGIVQARELEQVLVSTVRAAQAGQIVIPGSQRHQIFRPVLSHRENRVLAMLTLGRTNAEIAASLHLEESTVKSHLRSLFAKLGVRNREEAAAAAYGADGQVAAGVLAVTESKEQLVAP